MPGVMGAIPKEKRKIDEMERDETKEDCDSIGEKEKEKEKKGTKRCNR